MSQRISVFDVALDPRAGGSDAIYSYLPACGAQVGDAVLVPLGNRQMMGYIIKERTVNESELGFSLSVIKPIADVVDGLRIPTQVLRAVEFVAAEYLCPVPTALTAATPPGVKSRLVTVWQRNPLVASDLKPLEQEVLRVMDESGGSLEEDAKITEGIVKTLKTLRAKGFVIQTLKLKASHTKPKAELTYRLSPNETNIEKFLTQEGKKKPAQAIVIMQMQSTDGSALSSAEIRAMAGVTETTIRALVTAKLLEAIDDEHLPSAKHPPAPNPAQQLAIDVISAAIIDQQSRPFLLFGVTGSGKTEVFLRCAAQALQSGRQILYLVPEIALAAQAIAQLRDRFGGRIAILHSEQTPLERLQNWQRIRNGEASIVLGPRSALFAPLNNIGLIIMDEEHENGYKQEQSPRYQSRTVAKFLAREHSCPLILGSATPSLESFSEAEANESLGDPSLLTLLTLPNRAASAVLPKVFIDDLTNVYRLGTPSMFGAMLSDKISQTIDRGDQVILFLNRRAYSPFLLCRGCGHRWMCPSCAAPLSFHRSTHKIKCHHCGYQEHAPQTCEKCFSDKIKPFGIGTEKVEETVAQTWPNARVARLDRDVAAKKGALEEVIASFRAGDTNVLVGTQLVAKGLDFPNVTLVGVIAADVSLNLPDFRSSERTFQLLSQVAGRAGRSVKKGEVVIQTFNPSHPSIQSAQHHDYLGFFQYCQKERSEAKYPPFNKLINIVFTGESRNAVVGATAVALAKLQAVMDIDILGPADCPLERLANRYRRHLLIKLKSNMSVALVGDALSDLDLKSVQMVFDVDPFNLM
jgi:primosomal protein N' (replication factor Y) (superfamily II helicase)